MVNRVIGRRMAKKQPMRWGRRGAHFRVQIRVAVLDGRLPHLFQRGYPRFEPAGTRQRLTPPRGWFHFQTFLHLIGQPEGKGIPLLNDLRFLATFGESSQGVEAGGIPLRGAEVLPPPKKTDAHTGFTKSGQEPDLNANVP